MISVLEARAGIKLICAFTLASAFLCIMYLRHLSSFREKMRKTHQNEWPVLIKLMILEGDFLWFRVMIHYLPKNEFSNEKSKSECTPTQINQIILTISRAKRRTIPYPAAADKEINMSGARSHVWGANIPSRCSAFSNPHILYLQLVLKARRNGVVFTF